MERTYVYNTPAIDYDDERSRGPVVGSITETSTMTEVYWLGEDDDDDDDQCSVSSSDSSADPYNSKCMTSESFVTGSLFQGWLNSGTWRMSNTEGRPILSWEDD